MSNIYKILTVIGARPQFVKAAVVSRLLQKSDEFVEIIVHTGQHYDPNMSEVFFQELSIPQPDYNLNISSLSHGAMTGRMLEEIEKVILAESPDFVLVYGDTNSTLAGAVAAKKLNKKVIHVEAGLRSFDMTMPEEINRILTDRLSDTLFCPTQTAVENLQKEGYENFDCLIYNSGDVMHDAVMFYRDRSINSAEAKRKFFNLPRDFVLCTIHRAENTDSPEKLSSIFRALDEINKSTPVILPLHPRTKQLLKSYGVETSVELLDPVSYLEMLYLLDECSMVLTDSGGLQKEAFFFRKFCVTMRETTEWTELVEHGVNFLAGSSEEKILQAYQNCLSGEANFSAPLYGNGKAGEAIVNGIKAHIQTEEDLSSPIFLISAANNLA